MLMNILEQWIRAALMEAAEVRRFSVTRDGLARIQNKQQGGRKDGS